MNENDFHKHISELYLQYEHLKKEIKRDREELYEAQCKLLVEVQKQNKLLREERKSQEKTLEAAKLIKDFLEAMKQYGKKK